MKKIIIINKMKWFRFLLIACIAVSCTNEVAYEAPVFVNMQPKEIR